MINSYDQLVIQQLKGHYPDYYEPIIKFMPTYKRNDFDNDGYVNKKNQCPSYTDRILFKLNSKCVYNVHEYTSIDNQFGSDHRPVALTLTIELKPYNYIDPSVFLNTLIPD